MKEKKKMDFSPLWNRYLPMFEDAELSDRQVGSLTMAILRYQSRGILPEGLDPMCKAFWGIIHQDLIRARMKYDASVANGRKQRLSRKNLKEPRMTRKKVSQCQGQGQCQGQCQGKCQ